MVVNKDPIAASDGVKEAPNGKELFCLEISNVKQH